MANQTQTFAAAATSYAQLIEAAQSRERDEFLSAMHAALAALQLAVQSLPDTENDGFAAPADAKRADRDALEEIVDLHYAAVDNVLDDEAFSETAVDESGDPVADVRAKLYSVADDLADIYDDLQDGLSLLAAGREGDALWHWRTGYFGYWGKSLTGTQSALWEFLAVDYGDPEEEET